MIDLKLEHKPYFYIGAAMLSAEIVYVSSLASGPQTGWAVYIGLLALAVSAPMLIGACLSLMVGYFSPAKTLLLGGLIFGVLWFIFALAGLSKLASFVFVGVSIVSYKMLGHHHIDSRVAADSAQQGAQADGPKES